MTYREAVDAIEAVGTESIKNTTEETRRLLHALGDPDRRIPLIHVAGTNGKGSVCAYLESVLRAGGRTCGLFTSPHLRRINERFRIGGEEIGDEEFAGLYERVRNVIDREVRAGAPAPGFRSGRRMRRFWSAAWAVFMTRRTRSTVRCFPSSRRSASII